MEIRAAIPTLELGVSGSVSDTAADGGEVGFSDIVMGER